MQIVHHVNVTLANVLMRKLADVLGVTYINMINDKIVLMFT